ncbi:MAG: 30S ribosomal protein S16 [Candidatus Pacebacteria bacterium]|nr:30S ribosomal protein S16 [Candidatus Paceibacterota bacterium]MDD5012955.1 30S ribosomal protein S16 [Candidatus Paceibacterota bacterium]MDD5752682.1 30S ribosomal protein S16 [Candidatus Paceibacterota bacterium]
MIRLFRIGKKKQPSYKIVVTDKKNAPARGRFVEEVGTYNPLTKEFHAKKERVDYWLGVGVQISDTVHNLFIVNKIIEGKKRKMNFKKKEVTEEQKESKTPATVVPTEKSKPAEAPVEKPKEEPKEAPVEKPTS